MLKRSLKLFSFLLLIFSVSLLPSLVSPVFSDVPNYINYQGRLRYQGQPVSGNRNFTFGIYNVPTGGSAIGNDIDATVRVSTGVYSHRVGPISALAVDWAKENTTYYFSIQIESNELLPRMTFSAVPYSFVSRQICGYNVKTTTDSQMGIGTINPRAALEVRQTDHTKPYGLIVSNDSGDDYVLRVSTSGNIEGFKRLIPKNSDGSIFIGSNAGRADDLTDNYNVFIGSASGYSNTTGSNNVFLGYMSGYNTLTGNDNTFSGFYCGYNNTTGESNMYIGAISGFSNQTGSRNTFVGCRAAQNNIKGKHNTAIGYGASTRNLAGSKNTSVGYYAGYGVGSNSFSSSTIVGAMAGYLTTTGSRNTLIGYKAGYDLSTGGYNIVITTDASSFPAPADNSKLNIGDTIYGDLVARNVGIGTINPQAKLAVNGGVLRDGSTMYANTMDYTHMNLGYDSITGENGSDYGYCTISGGYQNIAAEDRVTIGGGGLNSAQGANAVIGGGYQNWCSDSDTVIAGGYKNTTLGSYATISGGRNNRARSIYCTIGGGYLNVSTDTYNTISGGLSNATDGDYATIGGGRNNSILGNYSVIGAGSDNKLSGLGSTISGGTNHNAEAAYGTIGGGNANILSQNDTTISGGIANTASNTGAAVGGGNLNVSSGTYSVVGGGQNNHATHEYCFVGGGRNNYASGSDAVVMGGNGNKALGAQSTICGGINNTTSAHTNNTIGGGYYNAANNDHATVSGGRNNVASGYASTVSGGYNNEAQGYCSWAAGRNIHVTADYAYGLGYSVSTVSVLQDYTFIIWGVNVGIGYLYADNKIQLDSNTYGNDSGWYDASDRDAKEKFTELKDVEIPDLKLGIYKTKDNKEIPAIEYDKNKTKLTNTEILNRLEMLPIMRWSFIKEDEKNKINPGKTVWYIGPTAQDFYKSFQLGGRDTSIQARNMAGVSLAGIKALIKQNKYMQQEIELLKTEISELKKIIK